MSGPKRGIVVSRSYRPAPSECARALELLLKKPVKEGGYSGAALENARKECRHVSRKPIIPGG